MPKYVASTTLTDPRWAKTTVLSRDVAAAVGELKAKPGGELQVHGSGGLIRWLLDHDLVDEITCSSPPWSSARARGCSPTPARTPRSNWSTSRATPSGVTIQVYRPTGRPQYGTATAEMTHVRIDPSSRGPDDRSDRQTLSNGRRRTERGWEAGFEP